MNGIQDVTKDAVSLGEGFTITGGFGAVTRSYYEESIDGTTVSLKSKWEPNDSVGAAWYAAYTTITNGTPSAGFVFDGGKYASNHPFTRVDKEGDVETAEFETVTNMFAGKYTLYYPFDKTVAQAAASIPVKANVNQIMDVANPLKHVNEEIFFYTNGSYTKGGNQAEEFQMSPVPVLYRLNFAAKSEAVKGLIGQDIVKVVISSSDNLFSEGKITATGTGYADYSSAYSNVETEKAEYSLEFKGNEGNADYQISAIGEEGATKKPVYLSILPAKNTITSLTFTVITADGKVYKDDLSINAALREEVAVEGGFFNHTIQLESVVANAGIFNAQQFKTEWDKAVEKGGGTLKLAAPVSLDELTLTKAGAQMIIEGKTLTVGTLNISGGNLTVGSSSVAASLEATDVNVGALGVLADENAGSSVKINGTLTVELGGKAVLDKVSEIKNVVAEAGSTVSLESGKTIGSFDAAYQANVTLKNIELAGTNSLSGAVTAESTKFTGATTVEENAALTVSGTTSFKNMTNNGTITLGAAATIAEGGTFENNGTLNLATYALTNNGTLTLNVNPNCSQSGANIKNEAKGIINVNAADVKGTGSTLTPADLKIDNNPTANGVVNINLPQATDQVTFAALKYCKTVNVINGDLTEGASAFEEIGEIIVSDNGKVSLSTASYPGLIVVNKDSAIEEVSSIADPTNVACYIVNIDNVTKAGTVVINEPTTITSAMATKLEAMNVIVEANITLDDDLTIATDKTITFNESVTITGTAATKKLEGATSGTSSKFVVAAGKIVTVGKDASVILTEFHEANVNKTGYGVIIAQGGAVTLK